MIISLREEGSEISSREGIFDTIELQDIGDDEWIVMGNGMIEINLTIILLDDSKIDLDNVPWIEMKGL